MIHGWSLCLSHWQYTPEVHVEKLVLDCLVPHASILHVACTLDSKVLVLVSFLTIVWCGPLIELCVRCLAWLRIVLTGMRSNFLCLTFGARLIYSQLPPCGDHFPTRLLCYLVYRF